MSRILFIEFSDSLDFNSLKVIIYKDNDYDTDIDHFDKKRTELLQGKKSPVNSKKDLINFVQSAIASNLKANSLSIERDLVNQSNTNEVNLFIKFKDFQDAFKNSHKSIKLSDITTIRSTLTRQNNKFFRKLIVNELFYIQCCSI